MKIEQTVKMMFDKDYRERMKAEYWQVKCRYEKLKKMNTHLEAERLCGKFPLGEIKVDGTPWDVLRDQQRIMGEYLHVLELRAELEGVDLEARAEHGLEI